MAAAAVGGFDREAPARPFRAKRSPRWPAFDLLALVRREAEALDEEDPDALVLVLDLARAMRRRRR